MGDKEYDGLPVTNGDTYQYYKVAHSDGQLQAVLTTYESPPKDMHVVEHLYQAANVFIRYLSSVHADPR